MLSFEQPSFIGLNPLKTASTKFNGLARFLSDEDNILYYLIGKLENDRAIKKWKKWKKKSVAILRPLGTMSKRSKLSGSFVFTLTSWYVDLLYCCSARKYVSSFSDKGKIAGERGAGDKFVFRQNANHDGSIPKRSSDTILCLRITVVYP